MDKNLNEYSAYLTGIVGRLLVERKLFQNNQIPYDLLVSMSQKMIQLVQTPEKQTFSVAMELRILWKEIRGIELTKEEKAYQLADTELDVVQEIANGLIYSSYALIGFDLFSATKSALANRLSHHLPGIFGITAAKLLAPSMINATAKKLLQCYRLTEKQHDILLPWINAIGNLAIGFLPKMSSDAESLSYQFPSSSGYFARFRRNEELSLYDNIASVTRAGTFITPEGEFDAKHHRTVRLGQINKLDDESIEITVYDDKGERIPVVFHHLTNQPGSSIKIECEDKSIADHWQSYFSFFNYASQFASSALQKIDSALSFPLVAAAEINSRNQLYNFCPEFLRGTTEYKPATEEKLDALMRDLHRSLHSFLKQPSNKTKIIVLGETHDETFFVKLMLLNYIKQWEIANPARNLKVRFVQEFFDNNDKAKKGGIATFKKEFKKFALGGVYNREVFAKFMDANCFIQRDKSKQSALNQAKSVIQCAIPTAIAYDFDFDVASLAAIFTKEQEQHFRSVTPNAGTKANYFLQNMFFYHELFGTFAADAFLQGPYVLQAIDQSVIDSLKSTLADSQIDIVIFVTGVFHVLPVTRTLNELNQPYVVLRPERSKKGQTTYDTIAGYTKYCFKPLVECPLEYGILAKEQYGQKFCLLNRPYKPADCDKNMHDAAAQLLERHNFARDPKNAIQLPATLPHNFPNKLFHMFAPTKTLKYIKNEFSKKEENNDAATFKSEL